MPPQRAPQHEPGVPTPAAASAGGSYQVDGRAGAVLPGGVACRIAGATCEWAQTVADADQKLLDQVEAAVISSFGATDPPVTATLRLITRHSGPSFSLFLNSTVIPRQCGREGGRWCAPG